MAKNKGASEQTGSKPHFPGVVRADVETEEDFRELDSELSHEELKEKADEHAGTTLAIDDLLKRRKEQNSELNDEIKSKRGHATALALEVKNGVSRRQVRVTKLWDLTNNALVVKRNDTNEIVEERAITAAERQRLLEKRQTKIVGDDPDPVEQAAAEGKVGSDNGADRAGGAEDGGYDSHEESR